MNVGDARKAHKILDNLLKRKPVLDEEREFLRSALPELPKQKTLEEIIEHVNEAWAGTRSNTWWGDGSGVGVYLEDWLSELREQLQELKDVPANTPALPAGMRIAEHENFGRVVVSPGVGIDRCHEIFYLDPGMSSGTDISEVEPDSLTFIDAEPAKPAHPEFLETEGDYASAPAGTVAAKDGWLAWVKQKNGDWSCDGGTNGESELVQSGRRRVLRWGWQGE